MMIYFRQNETIICLQYISVYEYFGATSVVYVLQVESSIAQCIITSDNARL